MSTAKNNCSAAQDIPNCNCLFSRSAIIHWTMGSSVMILQRYSFFHSHSGGEMLILFQTCRSRTRAVCPRAISARYWDGTSRRDKMSSYQAVSRSANHTREDNHPQYPSFSLVHPISPPPSFASSPQCSHGPSIQRRRIPIGKAADQSMREAARPSHQ